MIFSRTEHWKFLEEELRAQTEAFKQKLDTSATYLLLERDEVFVAQFMKFEDGEMILKLSDSRGLPRIGEYLYCMIVPKELRDYRNWGNMTYGDLVKAKTDFSELVCIWHAKSNDDGYGISGFRGVDLDFANNIQGGEGIILILGPHKPPYEYLTNLQKIVQDNNSERVNLVLDQDFSIGDWQPALLDGKANIPEFILSQLSLQDTLIIEGPPGTGKTHLMAEVCEKLCTQGKSVLVTALTNRALIELAEKPALKKMLEEHRVLKTKLSVDEAKLLKDLQQAKAVSPQSGKLVLSTFYITSGEAVNTSATMPFDYVIVDEASQALLGMFAAAKLLGDKNIWIGDTKQLPPVVALSNDIVSRKSYVFLIDGLKAFLNTSFPVFQLTESHRLAKRGAAFTGIFYNNSLKSVAKSKRLVFDELPSELKQHFHPKGGPTLITIEMPIGSFKPAKAIELTADFVQGLLNVNEKLHVSVLTFFVETTKALQKEIYSRTGHRKNLLVETVARVQGLTTDICIYLIPNASYHRSLEPRIFNVATSRSSRHTLIIADESILERSVLDDEVKEFLHSITK